MPHSGVQLKFDRRWLAFLRRDEIVRVDDVLAELCESGTTRSDIRLSRRHDLGPVDLGSIQAAYTNGEKRALQSNAEKRSLPMPLQKNSNTEDGCVCGKRVFDSAARKKVSPFKDYLLARHVSHDAR